MKSIEMRLANVDNECLIETIAHLWIDVTTMDEDWLISTARGLLSMAPYVNLGVVVSVDGEFYRFYSMNVL